MGHADSGIEPGLYTALLKKRGGQLGHKMWISAEAIKLMADWVSDAYRTYFITQQNPSATIYFNGILPIPAKHLETAHYLKMFNNNLSVIPGHMQQRGLPVTVINV